MGAIHKVDSNVLGPDSATLSEVILLPVNTDMDSKRSKRLHVNERGRVMLRTWTLPFEV